MVTAYIWHKFYLHGKKIAVLALLFVSSHTMAQHYRYARMNNPNYDDRRKLTYGFLIQLHTTEYQVKHSPLYVTKEFDTLYAVEPQWSPGFALGFIVNYRLADYLDFRMTPEFSFYENKLEYLFTDQTKKESLTETTMVEFPLLLKYMSARRGNIRMYTVGGLKPGIEASGKKEVENLTTSLEIKNFNLSMEVGLGFDMYFPLFKFSPELRFSRGLVNLLNNTSNIYGQPLKQINTNTVSVLLLFQ